MDCQFGFPIVVYIVAKILNKFSNEVRTWRLMSTTSDIDITRTIITGIGINPEQCFAV